MASDLIRTIIGDFWDKPLPLLVPRYATFPSIPGKVQVAMGMRRVGKTYFLYQQVGELLKQNVSRERILFLNLEDDRILPLNAKGLGELIDTFYSLYPNNHERECYLFLDEIQNVDDWPIVVRRLLDTKNVKIFLSGSSAKLLSKEISTHLRGRSLSVEIWPYSFLEYLTAKNLKFKKNILGSKQKDQFNYILENYLFTGGFPEVISLASEDRLRILRDYINVVVQRDIIERYEVSNIMLLKEFIKFLIAQSGNKVSINKCFNDFKSRGLKLSKNTLNEYLGYIHDSYLCFPVPLFTHSIRRQNTNPRKMYAIDTGLIFTKIFLKDKNFGSLFENLIFLDLKRKGNDIYYYITQSGFEIDFVVVDLKGKSSLYQVCWDTSDPKTFDREKRALLEAQKELGVKGQIITKENYWSFVNTR